MNFSPDLCKHAWEIIFILKFNKASYFPIFFIQTKVKKYLGITIDSFLTLNEDLKHLKIEFNKAG